MPVTSPSAFLSSIFILCEEVWADAGLKRNRIVNVKIRCRISILSGGVEPVRNSRLCSCNKDRHLEFWSSIVNLQHSQKRFLGNFHAADFLHPLLPFLLLLQ